MRTTALQHEHTFPARPKTTEVWSAAKDLTIFALCILAAMLSPAALAAERGTFVRAAPIYTQPDPTSAKVATVQRGQEAVLLERTPGWIRVVATLADAPYTPEDETRREERTVAGWALENGYISESTANGDAIVFAEAADSEDQASRKYGRKGAAGDARRLYYRVYDLFPKSPLAGEALYRAADIQWQLDRAELESRALYKTLTPDERQPINEEFLRLVRKKFPGSRWDELAAYEMLDNKLCGDWSVAKNCPEHEAEVYEKYAAEHPNSPKAPEALYNAAYRWAAVIAIYKGEGKPNKIPEAQKRAIAGAQKLLEKNASPEWNAKAHRLLYLVQNNIPVYGTMAE